MAEPWTDKEKLIRRLIHLLPTALADQVAEEVVDSLWLAAHDAAKRAEWEAERGETEWEYATEDFDGSPNMGHYRAWGSAPTEIAKFRRRKAGPWLPVPDTGAES